MARTSGGRGPDRDRINIRDFGPIGTSDDTAVVQAAVDAAISSGNPASTTRRGLKALYAPAGEYTLTSPINFRSVLDFHFYGDGRSTKFRAGAPGMTTLFDLNGVAYSSFENFAFRGGSGAGCERALWLRWNGMARSTTSVHFSNIQIRDLAFTKAGFELGDAANQGVQVDTTTWRACEVFGGRTAGGGDAVNYQAGFYVGDGLHANNLLHAFYGCTANATKYGVYNAASQVLWDGGCLQNNDADFYCGSSGYSALKGFRSEGSKRLMESAGPASYAAICSLEDIVFTLDNLHDDGYFIKWYLSGALALRQLRIPAWTGKTPKIQTAGTGVTLVSVDGLTATTAWGDLVNSVNGATTVAGRYVQQNSSGQAVLVTVA